MLFLLFQSNLQQKDGVVSEVSFSPGLLFLVQKLAHAGEDAPVAEGFNEFDTFFQMVFKAYIGPLFYNLFVDRPAVSQEIPDVINISVRRFCPLDNSNQLVREHIFSYHDQHGDAEIVY